MAKFDYQAYCSDINQLVKHTDKTDLSAITEAVGRLSQYPHALSEAEKAALARVRAVRHDKKADIFIPKIAFDLAGKTVLMAGYAAHKTVVNEVIQAHNGRLIVFDKTASGKGKGIASNLVTAVKHADVVVVMLHAVSHETANKAIAHAKAFHKMVATSNVNSPLGIEDAIKRALNHEPVYQQASHVVE